MEIGTAISAWKFDEKNKKIKNSLLLSLSRKSLIFLDSFKYVYFIFLRSNIGIYLPTIYLDWLLAAEASANIEFLSILIFTLEAISSTI